MHLNRSLYTLCLSLSALLLTGCVTTQGPNSTASSGIDALLAQLQDEHAYPPQSDPLGAYLANRGKTDVVTTYSRSGGAVSALQSNHNFANTALDYLGIKYKFGGSTPSSGFDCSGLVGYVAEQSLGLKLPRRSAEIARQGQSIKQSELEKGDLVFFNTSGKRFSHVGIYLGNNQFVHAPSSGSKVRVEDMSINYWKKRYNGARRLAAKL